MLRKKSILMFIMLYNKNTSRGERRSIYLYICGGNIWIIFPLNYSNKSFPLDEFLPINILFIINVNTKIYPEPKQADEPLDIDNSLWVIDYTCIRVFRFFGGLCFWFPIFIGWKIVESNANFRRKLRKMIT